VLPIPASGLTVGRRPENDLVLADPSVSGRHALLRLEKGAVWVEDLGSTNGTKLGGRSVGRTEIAVGDRVTFGSVECEVVADTSVLVGSGSAPQSQATSTTAPSALFAAADELNLEDADDPPVRGAPAPRPMPAQSAAPAAAPSPAAGRVPAPRAAPARVPHADPVPEAHDTAPGDLQISALDIERARKRGGPAGLLVAVAALLALGAAAAWYFTRPGAEGEGGGAVVAVPAIAGDLLGGAGQFEGEERWSEAAGAPFGLEPDSAFAASGRMGVGLAGAAAGEWGGAQSAPITVRPGQVLEFGAQVLAEAPHRARLGVVLASSSDRVPEARLLGPAHLGSTDFESLRAVFTVPADYDRAVVLLHAAGGVAAGGVTAGPEGAPGSAAFDDVFVRSVTQTPARTLFADWHLVQVVPDELLLLRFDRLYARVRIATAREPLAAAAVLTPALGSDGRGLLIRFEGAPAGARLDVAIAAVLFEKGVATMASADAGGFRTHAPRFERTGARALLLGEGAELVRVVWPSAMDVEAAPADGWLRVAAGPLVASGEIALELAFQNERVEARRLAEAARAAADVGVALAHWNELLARFPFEAELVREAEVARVRSVERGLEELRGLEAQAKRAEFFGLDALLQRAEDAARDLAARYGASEVAPRALELAQTVAERRLELRGDPALGRRVVLGGMRAYFERTERGALAERVARSLEQLSPAVEQISPSRP